MKKWLNIILCICICTASNATTLIEASRLKVYSLNKKYYLIVDSKLEKIHANSSSKNRIIWEMPKTGWLSKYVISNDGTSVAELLSPQILMKEKSYPTAIIFYKNGQKVNSINLIDLIKDPPKVKRGPIGDHWKEWYTGEIALFENNFAIQLSNGAIKAFSLKKLAQTQNTGKDLFPIKKINKVSILTLPDLDSDKDGIPDFLEKKNQLDPYKKDPPDIDGDGFSNIDEIEQGFDFMNKLDHPSFITLCKVNLIKNSKIQLYYTIEEKSITLTVGEEFQLTGPSGNKENYKLKEISDSKVKIISFRESLIREVSGKPE